MRWLNHFVCLFQILEISEQRLAERLVQKGAHISREDISILLAEHLKTIEKLQQVSDAGKLIDQSNVGDVTPRMTSSEGTVQSLKKRPGSGKSRRKAPPNDIDSQSINSNFSVTDDNVNSVSEKTATATTVLTNETANLRNLKNNRLPPINQTKTKSKKVDLPTLKLGTKTGSDPKVKNLATVYKNNETCEQDSLQSSPETRTRNRRNLNESGIDSECDETETAGYEVREIMGYFSAVIIKYSRFGMYHVANLSVPNL